MLRQGLSPCQICVAPAHMGDIRASYAVAQVAFNSRGNLDIGLAMADHRKRGAPLGSVPFLLDRGSAPDLVRSRGNAPRMEAAAVIVLVLNTVVTSPVVVLCLLPKSRQIIYEPRRLDWEEHIADINSRGLFRRMYHVDEHTFKKLADLCSSGTSTTQVRSERERDNRGVTENFVFAYCGTAVQLERHEKIRNIFCGTAVQLDWVPWKET